jgi:hypothetical protein
MRSSAQCAVRASALQFAVGGHALCAVGASALQCAASEQCAGASVGCAVCENLLCTVV